MGSEPRLILATSTNEAYWPRAEKCLRSYWKHAKVDLACLLLDFKPQEWMYDEFAGMDLIPVNSSDLKLPLNNWCVQEGQFCDWIPGDPTDVILFTDADLTMQRPFNDKELEKLRKLRDGKVFVGYNAGPKDTLRDEALRLGIKVRPGVLEQWWDLDAPCFNWGCVAATRRTWEHICETYIEYFPIVDTQLQHVAKQQWLLSSITNSYFIPIPMPTSFHVHRHYGIPEGCEFKDGLVYSNGELALFAHKFDR